MAQQGTLWIAGFVVSTSVSIQRTWTQSHPGMGPWELHQTSMDLDLPICKRKIITFLLYSFLGQSLTCMSKLPYSFMASLMHIQTLIQVGKAPSSIVSCPSGFPYNGHVAVFPIPTAPLPCSRALQFVCVCVGE